MEESNFKGQTCEKKVKKHKKWQTSEKKVSKSGKLVKQSNKLVKKQDKLVKKKMDKLVEKVSECDKWLKTLSKSHKLVKRVTN